jgi:hypothetical protein
VQVLRLKAPEVMICHVPRDIEQEAEARICA